MPPSEHLLVFWAFPAVMMAFFIYRGIRIAARIKARREEWAAMSEAERQAERDERNRASPKAILWLALMLAALLVYQFSFGACRGWNPLK